MKTVIEVAKKLKIPVHKVYDEIRAGRVKAKKKGRRIYISEAEFEKFKQAEKRKAKLTPLREYLKSVKLSVSQYYRRRYLGCEIDGIVKIGGRLYVKEGDQ